ncbi:MAG: glycoside hydrolase N-terminal domain-containing protein, partial [Oscillospiraceae bacterium]|nr:glycoside hydrolase N-terminal domain-containing protein [Oscillospiraceae bacterium]
MKLRTMPYPYAYMPVEKRRGILPKHNVCSIAPAEDRSDSLYSGSGLYRIDVNGKPFADEITVTQEACYEPQWAKTPTPPDLRPYMDEIRRHVLDGEPEKADALIDKAQREAGMDKYMNLDAKIVYPAGSPHVHKAYTLTFARQEAGISDYLRFVDLYSGLVTTRWNQADGEYK